MSSLLEEAIVDAKALKEAALKNAEHAVLDKYSGEVKKALDTLLEQDELEIGEDVEVSEDLAEFIEDTPYAFQNEELGAPDPEEIIEIDFDALKERLAEEDEVVEEESLNDALEIADTLEEGDSEDPTFAQMADDEDAAEATTAVTAGGEEEGYLGLKEDEEIALTQEMLSDLIEELVVDMVPRPEGWSSVNSADNSVIQANNDAMAAAQAAHLEEDEEEEEAAQTVDTVSDATLYETQISQLTESTRELRALLIESKYQLTKMNLENAKLVYQNKALNSTSLNERQKTQIVEAVQSANSVEETGMIFETIQNAVGVSNSNSSRPQTLREAVQRPTSILINSKKNNTATIDPNMGRMLRLAGLNK